MGREYRDDDITVYDHKGNNDFSASLCVQIGKILGFRLSSAVFQMATGRVSRGAAAYTPPYYFALRSRCHTANEARTLLSQA